MAQDLGQFAKKMRAYAKRAEPAVAGVVKKLVTQIVEEVATSTPIDTGQARANWLTSIGTPITYYKANAGSNSAANESIDMAAKVMASWNGQGDIHIANNLPYIAKLNAGSSQQAPKLFVQAAVLRARYTLQSMKLRL
jgi:hypothetical protein